jgi:hypothetical protein
MGVCINKVFQGCIIEPTLELDLMAYMDIGLRIRYM